MAAPGDPPEMMRTRRGVRIVARAAGDDDDTEYDVVVIIAGITIGLELEESHRWRDLLQAAEVKVKRRRAADHEPQ